MGSKSPMGYVTHFLMTYKCSILSINVVFVKELTLLNISYSFTILSCLIGIHFNLNRSFCLLICLISRAMDGWKRGKSRETWLFYYSLRCYFPLVHMQEPKWNQAHWSHFFIIWFQVMSSLIIKPDCPRTLLLHPFLQTNKEMTHVNSFAIHESSFTTVWPM